MEDIREKLALVVKEKCLIQAAFAEKCGMKPMQLSCVLNKTRKLEANELFDVCDALGMTPCELRKYKEQPA